MFCLKLGFIFFNFFFFLVSLKCPSFSLLYVCLAVECSPTPRLVRSLVRIGFYFIFWFFSCVCFGVQFGLNFCLIYIKKIYIYIYFIAFKNINNIVEEAKCNFIETNH